MNRPTAKEICLAKLIRQEEEYRLYARLLESKGTEQQSRHYHALANIKKDQALSLENEIRSAKK